MFRALQLGDLLCTTPALRALRAAHPGARLTFIGLPWARELCERLAYIDDFIAFPGFPGLPEIEPQLERIPEFFARAHASRFDLIVQMHGSGALVNPIVVACGARASAGFYRSGEYCPDPLRYMEWPERGTEITRYLRLIEGLGLPVQGDRIDFPLSEADRRSVKTLVPSLEPRRYVCIHCGAQLPSRRWPPERFARVAAELTARGYTIVFTGTASETELVARVRSGVQSSRRASVSFANVFDCSGRTTLWQLGALIESAALLVCNDTGVSHIAAACGTPSVVVCSGADVERWSPHDKRLHRVLHHPVACRPCGHRVCPFGHECALGVTVEAVLSEAEALLYEQRERSESDDGRLHGARSRVA